MECDLLLDEVSLVDICLDTKNERFMMKPSIWIPLELYMVSDDNFKVKLAHTGTFKS